MPCSRIDAPFAQCPPRLIGESNTGSWRIHTPFCTTASIAQPREQCVQTVRLTSTLPSSVFASALPIMLYGSCVAIAPAPTVMPERLRKLRRSIVPASAPDNPRASRFCGAALEVAFRVSSMRVSSDLRSAVVVIHVLAGLIALRRALVFACLCCGRIAAVAGDHRRRGCGAAGADSQKEIAAGKFGFLLGHRSSYVSTFISRMRAKVLR